MRMCIIANSNKSAVNEVTKKYADAILKYAQNYNAEILNGGCNGIIEYVNNKIDKSNILNKIFSPAFNSDEHFDLYKYFNKNLNYIYENNIGMSLNYRFVDRSMVMIEQSDYVFVFFGMWGTLSELTFATMFGKKIVFLLEDNKKYLLDIYNVMTNINNYDYKEKIYIINSPEELNRFLENF